MENSLSHKPEIYKTDAEWRKELTPEQYRVMREQNTETPFSGAYVSTHEKGTYRCAACGNPLFSSEAKFDSGTGWPSFDELVSNENVVLVRDTSLGMAQQNHSDFVGRAHNEVEGRARTEVRCSRCDAHLGHLFNDGPTPTGKRYCINSVCLSLQADASIKEKTDDSSKGRF